MKYILTFIIGITLFCNAAEANLLVSPTRLVFEGKERTNNIILINTTGQTRSYRVEWLENTVDTYGIYSAIPANNVTFAASDFIRYSPRQVTLRPGERQTIKLMVRRNNNMKLPEYRSHLKFTALPSTDSGEKENGKNEGINFNIKVATSYVVPIMLRVNSPDVNVELVDVGLDVQANKAAHFLVQLKKAGKSSAHGDINIYLKKENEQEKLVGTLRSINFFHESNELNSRIRWLNYQGPESGTLRAEFVGQSEFTGRVFDVMTKDISISDF